MIRDSFVRIGYRDGVTRTVEPLTRQHAIRLAGVLRAAPQVKWVRAYVPTVQIKSLGAPYALPFEEWWQKVFAPSGDPCLAEPSQLVEEYDLRGADREQVEAFVEWSAREAVLQKSCTNYPEAYCVLAVDRLLEACKVEG